MDINGHLRKYILNHVQFEDKLFSYSAWRFSRSLNADGINFIDQAMGWVIRPIFAHHRAVKTDIGLWVRTMDTIGSRAFTVSTHIPREVYDELVILFKEQDLHREQMYKMA